MGGGFCCSAPQYGWGWGGGEGHKQEHTQERTRECCTYPSATHPLKSARYFLGKIITSLGLYWRCSPDASAPGRWPQNCPPLLQIGCPGSDFFLKNWAHNSNILNGNLNKNTIKIGLRTKEREIEREEREREREEERERDMERERESGNNGSPS